ncbi:MAG: hypothetical protein GXO35_07380, partial [Gammaproteobacteria bacterium]|nr:hypothetical protein [Gammaproteobacteria bacterium]
YVGVLIEFNPMWALAFFVVIWLFFANAITERVPLYFTNETTRQALKQLVANKEAIHFLDLGCGFGANVAFMAKQPAVIESHGVETAPVPYALSKLVTTLKGGQTYAMDLWKTDLSYYDVVYAFLSPEPMPKLWQKVQAEMRPGTTFVSNSFAIPGVEASEIWTLEDGRQTQLYLYHIE